MNGSLHRAISMVVVAAVLVTTTACHDTTSLTITAPQLPAPKTDRIVGVTTVDGQIVTFDDPAVLVDPKTKSLATPAALADPKSGVVVAGEVDDEKVEVPLSRGPALPRGQVKGNAWKTVGLVVGDRRAHRRSSAMRPSPPAARRRTPLPAGAVWRGAAAPSSTRGTARYVFDAEPYGGAITRGLERTDDVVLDRLQARGRTYRVLMSNERPETQLTNHVSLRVVDPAPGVRVVPGRRDALRRLEGPASDLGPDRRRPDLPRGCRPPMRGSSSPSPPAAAGDALGTRSS